MNDKINPAHYHGFEAGKVETIDDIRGRLWDVIVARYPDLFQGQHFAATRDLVFVGSCLANAMKYRDRRGFKGGPEMAAIDEGKAVWYERMADSVMRGDPALDPRNDRPGWVHPTVRAEARWAAEDAALASGQLLHDWHQHEGEAWSSCRACGAIAQDTRFRGPCPGPVGKCERCT